MEFKQAIEGFTDDRGLSPTRIAAYLDGGGDVNAGRVEDGRALLHFAAEDRNVEVIRLLASRGADLDLRTPGGWTALHFAVDADVDCASNCRQEITLATVAALIELGACETIPDASGAMPRDIAMGYHAYGALVLYDRMSRVDWSSEPTLAHFAARCLEIVRGCGVDARLIQGPQISVAPNPEGHAVPRDRFFLLPHLMYARRHDPDFEQWLRGSVQQSSRHWRNGQ